MVSISGQPVRISGQSVYFVSGQNPVQAKITDDGGTTVASVDLTDDGIGANDKTLYTAGLNLGYDSVTNQWKRLRVTASGQLIDVPAHKLIVAFSGDRVTSRISDDAGSTIVAVDSVDDTIGPNNKTLYVAAHMLGYDLSRDQMSRVGLRNANVAGTSGYALVVSDLPTVNNVEVNRVTITNNSGGTSLGDIPIRSTLIIQNESGNTAMNVGGNNPGDFPHANNGITLFSNERIELKVLNNNVISVWAATSGQRIRTMSLL